MKRPCMMEDCDLPVYSLVHGLCRDHDEERIDNLLRMAKEADETRAASKAAVADKPAEPDKAVEAQPDVQLIRNQEVEGSRPSDGSTPGPFRPPMKAS